MTYRDKIVQSIKERLIDITPYTYEWRSFETEPDENPIISIMDSDEDVTELMPKVFEHKLKIIIQVILNDGDSELSIKSLRIMMNSIIKRIMSEDRNLPLLNKEREFVRASIETKHSKRFWAGGILEFDFKYRTKEACI